MAERTDSPWLASLPAELSGLPMEEFVTAFEAIALTWSDRQRCIVSAELPNAEWDVERSFVRLIRDVLGPVPIVAEERMNRFGTIVPGAGSLSVTLDPLDGSRSYARGSSRYACSLAVRKGASILFGVVYRPATDQHYVAVAGGGAFRGSTRLSRRGGSRVVAVKSQIAHLPEVRAITGRLRSAGYRTERLESTSLKLCWTAEGRRAGVVKVLRLGGGALRDWGTAAGLLICQESGLRCLTWSGAAWTGTDGGLVVGDDAMLARGMGDRDAR